MTTHNISTRHIIASIVVVTVMLFVGYRYLRKSDAPNEAIEVEESARALPPVLTSEAATRGLVFDTQFPIRNRSNKTQTVRMDGTSCGCLSVSVDEREIHVGESFDVAPNSTTLLRLSGRLSAVRSSAQHQIRLSYSPNGFRHDLTISCRVDVLPDVEMLPGILKLTGLNDGETITLKVKRTSRGSVTPSNVPEAVECPSSLKLIGVSYAGVDSPPPHPDLNTHTWTLKFQYSRIDLDSGESDLPRILRLKIDGADGLAEVPVLLPTRRGIASPTLIHLGACAVGETIERRVKLHANDAINFRISEVRCDPTIKAEFSGDDRSSHWVDVGFQPKVAGKFGSVLVISTSHPTSPQLKILVVADVASESFGGR